MTSWWSQFSLLGLTLVGHPAFECAVGPCTKNYLAPSSDRPERAVDDCFDPRMVIFHHTIDSGSPGDDPRASEANVHNSKLFFPSFEDFCYQFQNAVHVPAARPTQYGLGDSSFYVLEVPLGD